MIYFLLFVFYGVLGVIIGLFKVWYGVGSFWWDVGWSFCGDGLWGGWSGFREKVGVVRDFFGDVGIVVFVSWGSNSLLV